MADIAPLTRREARGAREMAARLDDAIQDLPDLDGVQAIDRYSHELAMALAEFDHRPWWRPWRPPAPPRAVPFADWLESLVTDAEHRAEVYRR